MKKIVSSAGLILITLLTSCNFNRQTSDAYGNFEADDYIVSAELPGKVIMMPVEEGQVLKAGDTICIIDTTDLYLKKEVLIAQMAAVRARMDNTQAQAEVFRQQKENLLVDRARFSKMLAQKAATQKQVDDIDAAIRVSEKQAASALSANHSVNSEIAALERQVKQVEENIRKSVVTCATAGTVLERYLEKGELASPGKPLCKIADLSSLYLRVYIDGSQLGSVRIGNEVAVIIDRDKERTQEMKGRVSWISASAEFTPKIIQTREERVNLVYAVKVKVANPDGLLKIAMPGEIRISK